MKSFAVGSASFNLSSHDERRIGQLRLSTLPTLTELGGLPALLDLRGVNRDDDELEPVQLIEGCEYVYEVSGSDGRVDVDISELFIADDGSGRRGRLRTKLATGRVEVRISIGGVLATPIAFEVRSVKLGYLDDYRWMLQDIAQFGSGLLLERFAPSQLRIRIDPAVDAETLYQRFVFLRGVLESERVNVALHRIIAEPYVQWQRIDEEREPSRGIRGSGQLVRELLRAGPRRPWEGAPHSMLSSLPNKLRSTRTEEFVDNVPNRFVRFALEQWRGIVIEMLDVLRAEQGRFDGNVPGPVRRGIREGTALEGHLSTLLGAGLFRDAGPLTEFPVGNQVLQKRDGYRDVFEAYVLVQLGAALAWEGGDDVFGAGQRNVATLYEFWVFLELSKVVSDLCDAKLDLQNLIAEANQGLTLVLRREKAHAVRGYFSRRGRRFEVRLCFNQQFTPGPNGTWTRALRPDCSLHIVPLDPARRDDDVWLHFDAKYRVSRIQDLIGQRDDDPVLVAKTEDLYKMHTYRDAIVRAVGAYVVFPGTEKLTLEQFDEVLPGLGAFPLRPSRDGRALGSSEVRHFLQRAFDHVATQTTKHERIRYWRRTAIQGPKDSAAGDAVEFLERPPADTTVLLGFVKSRAHHAWIHRAGLYNLRADPGRRGAVGLRSSELAAELLALYGELDEYPTLFRVANEPLVLTAADLAKLEYPAPRGQLYFCLPLQQVDMLPSWWAPAKTTRAATRLRGMRVGGAPIATTWRNLAEEV